MAQQVRAYAAVAEDLGPIPSTHLSTSQPSVTRHQGMDLRPLASDNILLTYTYLQVDTWSYT